MPKYQFSVAVEPAFLPEQSEPAQELYGFAYTITVHNTGEVAAQLISRHWIINDARGRTEEVKGLGVVGQQPLLQPARRSSTPAAAACARPAAPCTAAISAWRRTASASRWPIPLFVLDAGGADGGSARVLH
jgi:ApaG protein